MFGVIAAFTAAFSLFSGISKYEEEVRERERIDAQIDLEAQHAIQQATQQTQDQNQAYSQFEAAGSTIYAESASRLAQQVSYINQKAELAKEQYEDLGSASSFFQNVILQPLASVASAYLGYKNLSALSSLAGGAGAATSGAVAMPTNSVFSGLGSTSSFTENILPAMATTSILPKINTGNNWLEQMYSASVSNTLPRNGFVTGSPFD